jgi:hypothetical protein
LYFLRRQTGEKTDLLTKEDRMVFRRMRRLKNKVDLPREKMSVLKGQRNVFFEISTSCKKHIAFEIEIKGQCRVIENTFSSKNRDKDEKILFI